MHTVDGEDFCKCANGYGGVTCGDSWYKTVKGFLDEPIEQVIASLVVVLISSVLIFFHRRTQVAEEELEAERRARASHVQASTAENQKAVAIAKKAALDTDHLHKTELARMKAKLKLEKEKVKAGRDKGKAAKEAAKKRTSWQSKEAAAAKDKMAGWRDNYTKSLEANIAGVEEKLLDLKTSECVALADMQEMEVHKLDGRGTATELALNADTIKILKAELATTSTNQQAFNAELLTLRAQLYELQSADNDGAVDTDGWNVWSGSDEDEDEEEEEDDCGLSKTVVVKWECEVGGIWTAYDRDASTKLETAYKAGHVSVEFKLKIAAQKEYLYRFDRLQNAGAGNGGGSSGGGAAASGGGGSSGASQHKSTQLNTETNAERDIRRREEVIITHNLPNHAIGRQSSAEWCSPITDLGNGAFMRRLTFPDAAGRAQYTRDNEEIKRCMGQAMMLSTKFTYASAKVIDWVTNPAALARFQAFKEQLRTNGKPTNEEWVFHGTPRLEYAESIVKDTFKIGGVDGHPVSNGKVWGQAVYSDVDPSTPAQYGKWVVLCKALPGARTPIGRDKANTADPCPGFDSWHPTSSADINTWRMFRKTDQLLPVYIIHVN
jgi:hypothetical protein